MPLAFVPSMGRVPAETSSAPGTEYQVEPVVDCHPGLDLRFSGTRNERSSQTTRPVLVTNATSSTLFFRYGLYGLVQFFSKPGSRLIVPVGVAGILYLLRDIVQPNAEAYARDLSPTLTANPWVFYGLLGIVFAVATCGYVILSRILAVVLGTFPPIVRPLPPIRRLRVATRHIRPAVVRQVVPKLRRGWF